jgi:ribonucleoside-diphosphate reductase alpha chain
VVGLAPPERDRKEIIMVNEKIRAKKYKASDKEVTASDTWRRVARGVADNPQVEEEIYAVMEALRGMMGGRMMAFAGTDCEKATKSNCYVLPNVPDDMEGIADVQKATILTLKAGGGVGLNWSKLRPNGSSVGKTGSKSFGPVSFMKAYNEYSRALDGKGQRKGAMIAVLDCSHPDIVEFINAKEKNTEATPVLDRCNLSVGITDAFMKAVETDGDWDLTFEGKVHTTVKARGIFRLIVERNHKKAEPGALYLDTINRMNNLAYAGEYLNTCNPCGELPLPENGACNLGSINLVKFVTDPFTVKAGFNFDLFKQTIRIMVRCLDNVVDNNYYPLPEQRAEAESKRRIGLGIMGLGSALAMLHVRYGSSECIAWVEKIMEALRDFAYDASADLAAEKGAFPLYAEQYLSGEFVKQLPEWLRAKIADTGIRNSHILTIAPTGTISQLVGNVTGGVEPIFDIEFTRRNYEESITTADYAWKLYCETYGATGSVPDYFATAHDLSPEEHIAVQAACQRYIDSSISKTINVRADITVDELADVYMQAWKAGLKGCTIYRSGSLDGEILSKTGDGKVEEPVKVHTKKHRPKYLPGGTYKVKIPDKQHAYYVGFTHDEKDGKPMEMFFNCKNPLDGDWLDAIAMLTSAVFRSVDDPRFLIEEFKAVSGASGFYSGERHKWVPSLVAEFGHIMEEDFIRHGLVEGDTVPIEAYAEEAEAAALANGNGKGNGNGNGKRLAICPRCGQHSAKYEGGCLICTNTSCLYDKCEGK